MKPFTRRPPGSKGAEEEARGSRAGGDRQANRREGQGGNPVEVVQPEGFRARGRRGCNEGKAGPGWRGKHAGTPQ